MRDQEGKALLAPSGWSQPICKGPSFYWVPWLALASILLGDTVTGRGEQGAVAGRAVPPGAFWRLQFSEGPTSEICSSVRRRTSRPPSLFAELRGLKRKILAAGVRSVPPLPAFPTLLERHWIRALSGQRVQPPGDLDCAAACARLISEDHHGFHRISDRIRRLRVSG